ncbi:hypothetical protein HYV84_03775, partial [Candidatus Woesearchaeota archaeon]|nr:hypothetical protein [Candidatus Woesearchaeota archaeon]
MISIIFSGWALAVPEPECKTFCTIKNPSEGILATTNNPSPFFIVTFEPADTQPSQERTRVVDLSTGLAVVPGGNFIFSSLPESTNRVAVIKYDFPDSLPTGKYKIFAASIYNVDGAVPPHEETFIIDVSPPSLDTFEAFEGVTLVTSDNKQNVSFGENTPIQIKVKASDKDGGLTDFVPETTVKQVAFYLNGQPQAAAIGADGSVSFSLSKPLGYYTGIIQLSDTLGTASEATFNFSVVDRTGPGISLRFPPGGKTVQDTEQLVFDLTEPSACILQREGSTEEIGTSTRSTVAEFTGVFIDTPAGGIIDNVISSFSVTCKDDSGNENTASVPITFIARAPRIMDLRSSRGDRINAFLKGKITSLHAETNSDASCFFKGGRFPLEPPDGEPEDPQSGMASFGKSGKLHDIDLTGRIIGGGIIDAQYTFYVRCRELGSEILTLVNNTNFTVNLNLRITDIAPSGVISSKSPSLFINLTRPALCRKVGDSDSFEQVVRQEYTLSMGQFEDGPHSVEVECSLNDRYSEKVSETISFTVDSQTIAPVIFSIQDALGREVLGSATNNRAITVQGTAEQGANVSVLVKDAAGSIVGEISTIAGQGIFTAGFILPEQGNTFSIESKATDAAGNVASGSPVAVTLDTTGPGDIVLDRIPSPTKESIAVVSGKTEADARVMLLDKDSIEVKDITFSTPKEKLFIVTTPAKDSVRGSKVLRFEGLLDQLFTQGRFIQIEDSLDRIKIGEVAATSTFGLKATKVTLVEGLPEDVIKDTTLIKVFNTSIPEGRFSLSIPVESQANEFNVRAVDSFENPSANDVPFTIILDQIVPRAAPLTSGTMGNNKTIIKVKLDGTGSSIDESSIGMAIRGPCSASGLRAPVEKGSLTFDNITGILSYQNDAAKLCNDGEYPDGTYSVAIGAKDAAGNILPDSSGWEFTIDTKLPSDPQFTVVDGIKKENTQWFKKSDGATIYAEFFESSISLIEIRADGIVLQSGTGFFKDSGNPNRIRIELPAIGSGTHIISVRAAKQSFQNAQTTANEATFTLKVVIDSTAPAVALSGPAITQSREVAITLAAVDENLKEIRLGGDFKRASQAPQAVVPLFIEGSQRLIKVNLSGENGTKTIQAAAEDFVGNIQTKEITIILDQEAPSSSLSLTDSLGNALVQEGVELVTGDNTIIISCACADPLAGCDDQKTIRGVKEKGSQTAAVVSGTAFTAGAGSGDKFLEVSCATQDNAGNLGEASVFVKIDRSAPQITVIEPVTGFTNKRINTLKLQTDDTAACFISSRSDFLQPFITKIPSSDMKLHIQPIDLKDKDANFDKDNPKTFAFYVQCNNSFGLKSPVTPIPITIDTTPLVITEISAAKPPFFIDDFQNTITVKTNKPAKCRFGDNVNNLGAGSFGTFAQLPESFVEEFSIARTLTRDFFNGIHSIRFDCMDKAGNLAANPSSFTFTVNVNEPLQSFGTAPSGRIADRTPDLAVKLNKQGSCRFNGSAATLIHKSLESGRELTVNAFNITALQRDGFHSFAVACNDLEDNYIYPLIEFFINTTPPEKPLIAQPSENEMFKNGLTVAGTAQDGVALINLFIDGSFVKSQAVLNGNFESTINATLLAEGAHVLEAEAEFPDGKEFRSGRSRTNIWKDTISNPPALIQPQLTTPIERFLVRGTSEPDAKVFIFREPSAAGAQAGTQGTPAAAQPQSLIPIGEGAADVNGDFTINIALVSGENLLFARAMDRSDNPLSEKSTQLRVMFDNLGPELSVTKPGNFANTNAFEVRVQAKDISNVTKATLTINTTPPSIIPIGASQLGREETTILEALTISNNGSFILTVDAEDIYGNKAAVIHPFILDTSVPDPAAFNLDGKTINIRNPVLEFNFTDEVKIVRLGGIAATPIAPSNARQFRYSASNLEDGNYNIFIVASSLNGAGGEGNFTFSFVVDATPPMVTADMPDKTTVEAIIIKGSCGDNLSPSDQVQLTVFQAGQLADNPFSCAGNSYSTQINLDGGDGFKFIEVRARDK